MSKSNKKEYIIDFLSNNTDEQLLERIIDDVCDDRRALDNGDGKHKVYYLQVGIDNPTKEIDFWKTNIQDFVYLYVYAMLFNWKEEWKDETKVTERFSSFQKDNLEIISTQIAKFKKIDSTNVPKILLIELKFITDSFLWNTTKTVPRFEEQDNIEEYRKNYERYVNNLKGDSPKDNVKKNIDKCFDYCISIDKAFGDTKALVLLLSKYSGVNPVNEDMLNFLIDNKDIHVAKDKESYSELYEQYYNLFLKTIENKEKEEIIYSIDRFLYFCENADKLGFTKCFRALVYKLRGCDSIPNVEDPYSLITIAQPVEDESPCKYNFAQLKIFLDFCCEHNEYYNISDEIISKFIYNIVCNRINEYINHYYYYVDKEKCVEFLREKYPNYHLSERFMKPWLYRVSPWNYVEYCQENGLEYIDKLFSEIYNDLFDECDKVIKMHLEEAKKSAEKYGGIRLLMKRLVKESTDKMLQVKNEMLKRKLIDHLQTYKKEKCIEIVNKAIKDVNTSEYINERLTEANLKGEVVVDCSECFEETAESDTKYSKISIKINNNELFSMEKDWRQIIHLFHIYNITMLDDYYKKVAKVWIYENIFGGSTKVRDTIDNMKEKEYIVFLTNYTNSLRDNYIDFIRNYLDCEFVVYYYESFSESYCDREESYDDYMWKHGY